MQKFILINYILAVFCLFASHAHVYLAHERGPLSFIFAAMMFLIGWLSLKRAIAYHHEYKDAKELEMVLDKLIKQKEEQENANG